MAGFIPAMSTIQALRSIHRDHRAWASGSDAVVERLPPVTTKWSDEPYWLDFRPPNDDMRANNPHDRDDLLKR
jgi:hypothetical protein